MKHITLVTIIVLILQACAPAPSEKSIDNTKLIALTYDDAPRGDGQVFTGLQRTKAFLEQLQEADTGPVAIFVTTRGLNKPEGRARINAYADAGHLIANHSDTHMWASRTDTQAYITDIDTAETKLEGFANRRPWFRFPYLDEGGRGDANKDLVHRDAIRNALAQRNLMSGYVTVDTFDWHLDRLWQQALQDGKTVNTETLSKVYVDMVLDATEHFDTMGQDILGQRPAQVVLLHENDLAASFTVDLVKALRANGWTIISPDEAFQDPIATTLPKTRFSGMGRIAALAADVGKSGVDYFDHWSADEDAINTRVEEMGVFKSTELEHRAE